MLQFYSLCRMILFMVCPCRTNELPARALSLDYLDVGMGERIGSRRIAIFFATPTLGRILQPKEHVSQRGAQ